MQLGLVVGTATSTVKHATLRGQKLLVVQPLMADRQTADGDPQIAMDAVGAVLSTVKVAPLVGVAVTTLPATSVPMLIVTVAVPLPACTV